MTDVVVYWADNTTTVNSAFTDPTEFSLGQLRDEITAIPLTVNDMLYSAGAWGTHPEDTIEIRIAKNWSSGNQTDIETVISNHVPDTQATAAAVEIFTGVTDANGELTINYSGHVNVPLITTQPLLVRDIKAHVTIRSQTTTSCTLKVQRRQEVAVALIGLTAGIDSMVNVSGATIRGKIERVD